jgi:hypothetical protein
VGEPGTGVRKQSLASWRKTHGFGVLCIHSPVGESFVVVPDDDALVTLQPSWPHMSESELRSHLNGRGLTEAESTEAVELARDWATTFSPEAGSDGVLWPLRRARPLRLPDT